MTNVMTKNMKHIIKLKALRDFYKKEMKEIGIGYNIAIERVTENINHFMSMEEATRQEAQKKLPDVQRFGRFEWEIVG